MKQVVIYRQAVDGGGDPAFVVRAGEVCTFIDEQQNKVYRFKKVDCNGRVGWTPDWADFRTE